MRQCVAPPVAGISLVVQRRIKIPACHARLFECGKHLCVLPACGVSIHTHATAQTVENNRIVGRPVECGPDRTTLRDKSDSPVRQMFSRRSRLALPSERREVHLGPHMHASHGRTLSDQGAK